METTKLIWKNGELIPWEQAQTHVLTHSLHYGGAVFEGIRCYQTNSEALGPRPAIFRLRDHMERFLYSMRALKMECKWDIDELCDAAVATVRENGLTQGYIRPLAYFGYGKMGLNPTGAPVEIIIACWPWAKYLAADALKMRTSSFMRIHPKTTDINAKLSGHYVNSIMASQEFQGECDEVLFLDYNGAVAEGPGENIFMVKDGVLLTPGDDTILKGFTRDTVMTLARDLGYQVYETTIMPEDLLAADEAFLTGTAAEISPVAELDGHVIGSGGRKITAPGPITKAIKEGYMEIVTGRSEKYDRYLTFV